MKLRALRTVVGSVVLVALSLVGSVRSIAYTGAGTSTSRGRGALIATSLVMEDERIGLAATVRLRSGPVLSVQLEESRHEQTRHRLARRRAIIVVQGRGRQRGQCRFHGHRRWSCPRRSRRPCRIRHILDQAASGAIGPQPRTGEPITIAASAVPAFKASNNLFTHPMACARCGFGRLRECSLDTIQTDFRRCSSGRRARPQ